jgi:hypothetical protein
VKTATILFPTRLLAIILTGFLLQTQLAFAAGCDVPMFAGARMFAAASSGSQFMATGDFNRDGLLDVVTTDNNNTVSVLLGNGDGTFQRAVNYTVPARLGPDLADDLAGVYFDINEGLFRIPQRAGHVPAHVIWGWTLTCEGDCGKHLVSAIASLHTLLFAADNR